uniref:FHA domain-containing protein n=1 Tax=Anopheles minimus TaxID=112268 RepID=A0A182WE42_9DIPT
MAAKDSTETSKECEIALECTNNSHPFKTRILTFPAGGKVEKLIGRYHKKRFSAKEEEILFENRSLSQSHAILFYQDGKLYLKDLCSLNGTYLNEEYIGPEKDDRNEPIARELKTGDILRFGKRRVIPTNGDVVNPIEARLTIKYGTPCEEPNEQLDETLILPSNYTPYEGIDLVETMILSQEPEKEPILVKRKKGEERNSSTKVENSVERGTETKEVDSCSTSTQVSSDELEKQTDCDGCESVSEEFYNYRKGALATIALCLLIIL